MEIAVTRGDLADLATPLLAVGVFEGTESLDESLRVVNEFTGGQITDVLGKGDFKGREGQTLSLYPRVGSKGPERVLVIGLGKPEMFDAERGRRAAAAAVKQAARIGVSRFTTTLQRSARSGDRLDPAAAGRAIAEGLELGSYRFDQFKSSEGEDSDRRVEQVELLESSEAERAEVEAGVRVGAAGARGENLARTLGNLPGNVATPEYLAKQASEIASQFGMRATILGPEEIAAEGMRALLAVAQGSEQEPRFIILEHRRSPGGGKPLLLVGKGLTFDSGGISIKPAAGMEEMKFDMCGSAAVLGAMHAIGELEVAADVVAIVPASENLLSGRALKPGDIIRSHQGKTIEVVNTDAEGRLILADALSFALRYDPAAIVDVATLTGACVIALGNHATGALGNDEQLLAEIRAAGDRAGERVWPLPMFDEYREQIKSEYADIKNSGGRWAGAITAAWFLREFVGDTPWVHLDIAGTAYGEGKLPYQSKGATGVPVRLFVDWILARAG